MKYYLIPMLLLIVSFSPIFGQITCDVFDVNAELEGNILTISLNTDLPDNTVLMIDVFRSYWEIGNPDEYAIDYYSEKSTVKEWRNQHKISVDNSKWETDLQYKQKDLAPLGLGFDVDKIIDSVNVRFIVPINQPNPEFGDVNSNLTGKKVSPTGLHTVTSEISISYPLNGNVSKKSKFADPLSLHNGETYSISKETPLMSEFDPSDPLLALEKVKYITAGNLIKVISAKEKDGYPWYKVEVFNNRGDRLGKGWINSMALMYQSLRIKE